ncbi:MAG: hypothetical protein V2A58_16130, partial [Planctomycetota bacterium]
MRAIRNLLPAVLLLSFAFLAHADDAAKPPLPRWDFEKPFDALPRVTHSLNDPADGWMRDNWGDNITQFVRDTDRPHSGGASLRIRCLWWRSGMAAALSNRFRIQADKTYVLRLWLRAESLPSERSAQLTVRTAAVQGSDLAPLPGQLPRTKWASHADRRCSVSSQWSEFILDVKPKYDCDAEIQFGFESIGTVWIDDVSLSEGSIGSLWVPAPPSDEPPRKGNLLYNGGFEVGLGGWGPTRMQPLEYDYGPRHIYVAAIEVPAPDGLFAARVDSTEWIESQFLRVRPGLPLT